MHKKNWKFKLGLTLVIVSIPLFLFIPVIPFLNIEAKIKLTLTTIVLVSAEVLFWGGGLLLGKELFTRYKEKLNPKNWFKKKVEDNINEDQN